MTPDRKRGSLRSPAPDPQVDETLREEIDRLRTLMRQLDESFDRQTNLTLQLRILSVLSMSSTRLAQVLRVHQKLGGDSKLVEEIRQAAERVREELENGVNGAPEVARNSKQP